LTLRVRSKCEREGIENGEAVLGRVAEEEEVIICKKKKKKEDQTLVFFGLTDTI
jgi:hypothetical protein